MDGQDRLCGGQLCVDKHRPQINGDQGRLPVVAMDYVRNPIHIVQRRQGRFGEVAVFGNVVNEIGIWVSGAEKFLVVNEIIDDAVPDILHNAHIEGLAVRTEVHLERASVNHFLLIFPGDTFVSRENDLNIAVLLYQRLGQRVHHITQTAGLNKGIALRPDKHNASSGGCIAFFRRSRFRGYVFSGFIHRLCLRNCFRNYLRNFLLDCR